MSDTHTRTDGQTHGQTHGQTDRHTDTPVTVLPEWVVVAGILFGREQTEIAPEVVSRAVLYVPAKQADANNATLIRLPL